jgi:hypothetical protein
MTNPLDGVGLLFHVKNQKSSFLGTCFGFRQPTHFLTAAHCLGNLSAADVAIGLPVSTTAGAHPVKDIFRHPTADLAILVLAGDYVPLNDVFLDLVGNVGWGDEFMAFGFPADVFGEAAEQPTARLFRGYFQRFLMHKSHLGFEYYAAEMNIGAPAGLSGGPLFHPDAPHMVTGLVTENLRSTTFLQAVEEVQEGGSVHKTSVQEMINYGVALLFRSYSDFLDQHIPPPVPK